MIIWSFSAVCEKCSFVWRFVPEEQRFVRGLNFGRQHLRNAPPPPPTVSAVGGQEFGRSLACYWTDSGARSYGVRPQISRPSAWKRRVASESRSGVRGSKRLTADIAGVGWKQSPPTSFRPRRRQATSSEETAHALGDDARGQQRRGVVAERQSVVRRRCERSERATRRAPVSSLSAQHRASDAGVGVGGWRRRVPGRGPPL